MYCAEGKHPLLYEHGTDGPRQIDQVMEMVGNELHMPAARYTSETKRSARLDILRRFANNDLQVISSMRCLDEGVDVPASRTAYLLSSSSNPRQFIQRRGRVLRKAPGKERADIIDFVVVPPAGGDAIQYETERSLLRRELARVEEFAYLADNEGTPSMSSAQCASATASSTPEPPPQAPPLLPYPLPLPRSNP
ncbi:helicase-related protein [Streptomyces sp. INA 01156]